MALSNPLSDLSLPRATDAPLLDAARGIEAMGSEESLMIVLGSVVDSLSSSLPEIRQALNAGNVSGANRLLHSIKGYVPLMCCDFLVENVVAVEKLSKTASAEAVMPTYATLEPILNQLLLEVRAYIQAQ